MGLTIPPSIAGSTDVVLGTPKTGDTLARNASGNWLPSTLNRSAMRGKRQVSSRGASNQVGLSGSATLYTGRFKLNAAVACCDLIPYWANTDWSTQVDVVGANSVTIGAALEYPYGASAGSPGPIYPIFFDGLRSGVVDPGGLLYADPIGIELAAGAVYGIRCSWAATGSPTYPQTLAVLTDNQGVVSGSDLVDTGTITSSTAWGFAPAGCLGTTVDPNSPSVVVIGDSIAVGQNDTNVFGYYGYFVRAFGGAFAATVPYQMMALSAHKLSDENTAGAILLRARMYAHSKHAICQLGINDTTNGASTATALASAQAIWARLIQRGLHVWQCTLTPYTSSSDNWATTGNQTVQSGEAQRTAFNDLIRNNWQSYGLDGFFDAADYAESARNSGKWAVSGGTNAIGTSISSAMTNTAGGGIHPSPYGYGIIANCVDLTKLV